MTHVALLRLSWPHKDLSQNARIHWARRAKATKAYRTEAWKAALAQSVDRIETDAPRLRWAFHPPDRRRRDVQNVIAMTKAAEDGIADAIGIDDQHFLNEWPILMGDPVPGGCVMVEVRG